MSGIAGILRFDGASVEPGLVERMTAAMAHRGPDGVSHWSGGQAALGQCMLCSTPESRDEHQPLANEDASVVLVLAGRIDNAPELRRELASRGAVLRDRTDAELVLRAVEAWGCGCPSRIDGDFAFVAWDTRRNEALCVRDRFGQKPFHYHWDGRRFAFASDVHALFALPFVPQVLNDGMVAEYLANDWLSHDETFWGGVLRLPQAHRMTVGAHGPRLDRYWEPDLHATLACRTEDEYAEHYRALLFEAVRRTSRAIGPLACEVSGGLDSSALLAVAEHLRRGGGLLAPSIDAYTLAFRGVPEADELEYVQAMREHLAIPIREVAPTTMPLAWYHERARRLRTFPSYPNGVMGLGIRAAARERGSRALMVGVGGDEWLCGSAAYYADAIAARDWRTLAACFTLDLREAGWRSSSRRLLRSGVVPLLPDAVRRGLKRIVRRPVSKAVEGGWLTARLEGALARRRVPPRRVPVVRDSQRVRLSTLASPFSAHARDLEEGLAAWSGVELRRPYFSRELVEFAFSTPERMKLRGNVNKHLHRKAMDGLLPPPVLHRQDKADFMVAFRRHRADLEAAFAGTDREAEAWVSPGGMNAQLARFGDASADGAPEWKLWTLFGCAALAGGSPGRETAAE